MPTDQETYEYLNEKKNPSLMDAEEWKTLRLKQLKKEGKNWGE